jgi:hypothetical protein
VTFGADRTSVQAGLHCHRFGHLRGDHPASDLASLLVSRRQLITAALILVVLSVAGTLIVVELTKSERVGLPPGCSAADRHSPGCRPVTKSGADTTTLTLLGVPFTLLAAIGAAWLTASAANTRQRASLAAEADRQRLALEAEAERHDATLRHERALADRAELRRLLDGLMVHIAVADRSDLSFDSAQFAYGDTQVEHVKEEARDIGRAAASSLTEAALALGPYRDQLAARLGAGHELAVAFGALLDDLMSVGQVMNKVAWPPTEEHERWRAETKHAYLRRRTEFFETAAKFVGTQVSE